MPLRQLLEILYTVNFIQCTLYSVHAAQEAAREPLLKEVEGTLRRQRGGGLLHMA